MDTPKAELVTEAPENDGMDTVPSDIESRHEDFMTTKVLFDTTQQNYETLRLENDQLTSKVASMETENETLKLTVVDLSNKVETAIAEVTKLSSQVAQQESELNVHRKKRNDLSDEREMLLKMSDRKDVHIDHLNGVIRKLEEQLQSAVGAKFEALARLDEIAGKEQKLSQKERQLDMEKELLHSEIASLRDNLNRATAETVALRHELTTTSVQFDIDLKRKTEELRTANSTIQLYSDTNQTLTNQCEENIQKLREQKDESCRLMERYQKELDSKVALAEMHKEDCDSYRAQIEELSAGMKERQRILDETIDQCGVYETKLKEYDDQHQTELDERDDAIAQLKQELKVVNEMLEKADEENQERMVDNYIPSANAMNRRLKSGLTFTEICTRYFSLVEQVKVKDQDIANLKLQFETVYQDIQEKAPEFDRVQVEYKKAVALNEELTRKIDDYIAERVVIRDELANSRSKFGYLERENAKLKTSRNDLARQVCYLLNEIECSRGGTSSEQDQSISSDMPANEVISSKLVTFSNIIEMQQNNEKLLLLVRDLSTKLEEMEEIQNTIDIETYESKCASYEKRLQDAEEARRANEELLGNCLREKDRYKQMVCDLMKETNKPTAGDQSRLGRSVSAMDVGDSTALNGSFGAAKEVNDKKVADLEQMLEEKVKQLQELRDEYSEYRKESKHTVKSMNEQFRSERDELRELTTANCKLQTQAAFLSEQIKTQQNNVGIYKNKIQTLEERNQTYEKTIAKHETSAKYMREEALTTMKKLQSLEVRCEHLQRENNKLIAENRQLEMQYQLLNRERVTNSSLQNNLEMIRGSFERWETDGRAKMEQRLDDTNRECFALRRRLQEEQDEYRKQIAKIKSDTQDSEKKFKDQLLEVETLRAQLKNVQEQLELKNQQLNELTNKMQNSPAMAHIDVPAVVDTAKIKELELQVLNAAAEIQKLTTQNSVSAVREARLRQVATEWEEEALKQKESFDMWKSKMAADLEAAQLNEAKLAAKVDELQTEIRLQAMETDSSMYDAAAENKARLELKDALQKISERERELRDLRTETNQLKIDLKTIEQKYSNEMQVHSADIQALTMCKDELNKCQEQIDQVRAEKDVAIDILKSSQSEFENLNKKLNEDKLELEQKLEYLNNQNTALHDHLQAQCNKAASSNDSMNESVNSSFLNRSLTDDEAKEVSSDKLLKVITYLRKEKDSSFMKVEILKNENTRLLSEIELLKKRLTEQAHQLSVSETPINAPNVVSASKYEELMRKVETLNSVTESNIHLRAEKEALAAKVNDLTERVTKVEDELFPLQEKNRELTAKNEEQAHVNQMLRNNVDHWRKRSSDLVDRNNKNPEEFKRLQNERENLAKMLTVEKNTVSNVNAQLAALTNEKAKTEQELAANVRLLHATSEEKKKIQDDLNALKQQNARLTQEIIEIKSQILKKEDDIKAVQTELTSKENLILEIKKKEVQIRQIAKKYKDSYFDLKSNVDTRQADLAAKPLEEQVAATNDADAAGVAARAEMEKIQTKKVEELSNQLLARQEEIEQLQKEIENLKKQDDKNLLAEARNRIAALTETNRQITRDYQVSKNQLQTCEQSRSEHDSVLAALKSQLEAKIKEMLDQDAARQETIARLTRENETLNTRVNQLHRQFQQQGSKPSTSSGTIEKSPSDPARTANVKPMATPSAQQSATVNPRRGGDTPLASIRPVPVQNSRIAAVLPTSQTSNVATVQGSSSAGNVTTALVPPQQQVHTTGNTSTAEAMSSSPTSSHTDYMPATSSAAVVVAAVPPMGSASAESTQEAESLSVNTNESSSSSSSQAVMQQQTVALVSPRVEVAPQNVSIPSQQVVDQAASTSGSTSSSFITAMSSHHQASSSNTVTTSQAGHKRPRDADGDSSTGVEESSASEKNSPQNKRTRVGEQTFQGVTESGLDVEYQVPTSSQRDQEYDVVAVDSDEDEENMDAVDVDENFEGDNNDTDEIESFGQDEGEGIDIDEDAVPNDSNEVDVVDDSSNAPNQSSSGLAVSSEARGNVAEVIELSPSGQENQQIQTISSGSDAGPSSQANLWRQAQTPTRQQQQQQQQQQSLVIQQAYEEMTDDSIVPSTPTLYVARRADGFSEAISSPHPTVPHGSRFTFGESGRSGQLINVVEGMDDTRVELNLLEGSGDGGQSSSSTLADVQPGDNVDLINIEGANNQSNEPVAGPSSQAHGSQIPVAKKKRKTDDDASTTNVGEHLVEVEVASAEGGSDGVSSEGEKAPVAERVQVEEDREAEASVLPRSTRSRRVYQRGRGMSIDNQRANQMIWHQADNNFGRYHPMPPHHQQQQHGNPHRGSPTRGGPLTRGGRGRPPRRPYR